MHMKNEKLINTNAYTIQLQIKAYETNISE